MIWLTTVVRLAIAPVLLGAPVLLVKPPRLGSDLAAAAGLVLLGAIHLRYWWRPWPSSQHRAVAAAAGMVLTNLVLLNLLGLAQPLLWLYPALVVGAGLRAPAAAVGVGLTALAAAAPMAREGALAGPLHPSESLGPSGWLGPSHSLLLAIVLAGLGMTAVRQLVALTADLHATRSELADLAVAGERERLARELHDLLGRTLALIAVKAELAGRLSATGDPAAEAEMREVQQLARQAVRDVREAVADDRPRSVAAELAAARLALETARIEARISNAVVEVDPAHATTIACTLREAVTNVVKHSGARTCRIAIEAADGVTTLEVVDDGRGPAGGDAGTGLVGLADRVHAAGGTFEAGSSETGGFSLRVRLGAGVRPVLAAEVAQ